MKYESDFEHLAFRNVIHNDTSVLLWKSHSLYKLFPGA